MLENDSDTLQGEAASHTHTQDNDTGAAIDPPRIHQSRPVHIRVPKPFFLRIGGNAQASARGIASQGKKSP